jgi:hypothetical protein
VFEGRIGSGLGSGSGSSPTGPTAKLHVNFAGSRHIAGAGFETGPVFAPGREFSFEKLVRGELNSWENRECRFFGPIWRGGKS